MISALSWVPKGVAKAIADAAEPPTKEEIEELLKSGALAASEESEDGEDEEMNIDATKSTDEVSNALAAADALGKSSGYKGSTGNFEDITDGLRELDMDNYDDEDEGVDLFSSGTLSGNLYYPSNVMDPYLQDKNDEDEEEEEDRRILPSDCVIVCACNEDDVNLLKIYILEEDTEDGKPNLFVHHEIFLPSFPLCTAWLDCNLKGGDKVCRPEIYVLRGWFQLAMGFFKLLYIVSMSTGHWCVSVPNNPDGFEILLPLDQWNQELKFGILTWQVDEVQPFMTLGGTLKQPKSDKSSKDKKKKKKKKEASITYKEDSHTDSVLSLAWNKEFRNLLASASADKSIKIWDIVSGKCANTLQHHSDKAGFNTLVQSVAWNCHQSTVLLSGSFDRTVVMMDMRAPSHAGVRWSVPADVESIAWDPHTAHSFVVSIEDGTVQSFDIRAAATNSDSGLKPSFTLHAHDKAVCAVSYNPSMPNLLATGSTDKTVKLWNISNNQPSCVGSWKSEVGAVFTLAFSEDSPSLLAIGGSKGKLKVWDTSSNTSISKAK
ncbi:putative WD repeat-containing protein [Nymphaea thermarum]|nr:putative WD repeat-containing protein [Nymphaea thermarum]